MSIWATNATPSALPRRKAMGWMGTSPRFPHYKAARRGGHPGWVSERRTDVSGTFAMLRSFLEEKMLDVGTQPSRLLTAVPGHHVAVRQQEPGALIRGRANCKRREMQPSHPASFISKGLGQVHTPLGHGCSCAYPATRVCVSALPRSRGREAFLTGAPGLRRELPCASTPSSRFPSCPSRGPWLAVACLLRARWRLCQETR